MTRSLEWQRNRRGGASMRHRSAGYSLTEILVVVAIIGVLSLITVPAFMNFQRAGAFKSAMRVFTSDVRAARSLAIQNSYDTRIELVTGAEGQTTREYRFFASRDGTTWTPLTIRGRNNRFLERPTWFESGSNFSDIGSDSRPDIIFHANGAAEISGTTTEGRAILAINSTTLFTNRYNIYISRSGQVKALPCQCNDQIDNDGDGFVDKKGLDTNKDGTLDFQPDPQCTGVLDNNEAT
jgi:prepilin-type N-terminal cleavage/methylation domain-containing protein